MMCSWQVEKPSVHQEGGREGGAGDSIRYFVIHPSDYADLEAAVTGGDISPPPQISERIGNAAKETGEVLLIFSMSNSRLFQGYAEVRTADIKSDTRRIPLRWRRLCSLPHPASAHLRNKYSGNHPVFASLDGEEVEAAAAASLISLLDESPEETLASLRPVLQGLQAAGAASDGHRGGPEQRRGGDRANVKRSRVDEDGKHPALFGLTLCDMTYEDYLEQYRLRQALARDQFHAALAASAMAAGGPPMGMMMGQHGPMGPMGGGGGYYPHGGGMHGGMPPMGGHMFPSHMPPPGGMGMGGYQGGHGGRGEMGGFQGGGRGEMGFHGGGGSYGGGRGRGRGRGGRGGY
jgi:hypothetical protein